MTESSSMLHKNPAFADAAAGVLSEMQTHCRSLAYATLLTSDGFEVASIAGDPQQHRRVASMASSIQALGDAVARELRVGSTEYIIIAAQDGNVIQIGVPAHALVLAAHFDAAETVGKALSIARLAAEGLAQVAVAKAA